MSYGNPEAYDRYMGRWSARLAPLFIRFAGIGDGARVLDVGCGTGTLSRALLAAGADIHVVGVDPAAAFVDHVGRSLSCRRATFRVGTVDALPFADEGFDATLGLLVLQEVRDPAAAVREMARVTRRGGCVAACTWDFRDGMPMLSLFWQAAEAVAPEAVARQRAVAKSRSLPGGSDSLAEFWRACGLVEVRTTALGLTMEFASFDDFWLPFLGGATPTSDFARGLNEATSGALAAQLRRRIAALQRGGSFSLPARAWAAAGIAGYPADGPRPPTPPPDRSAPPRLRPPRSPRRRRGRDPRGSGRP
jgi:ubiquinone/menaquinone biosynthesis C-methylase UbiE